MDNSHTMEPIGVVIYIRKQENQKIFILLDKIMDLFPRNRLNLQKLTLVSPSKISSKVASNRVLIV